MASQSSSPVHRLTVLILAPVALLAGIAIFGLVEYRHAIRAEAREEAEQWASPALAGLALGELREAAASQKRVRLYETIPSAESAAENRDTEQLEAAAAAGEVAALRGLRASEEVTAAGVPVCVLAAWRIFALTGEAADAEELGRLAIHDRPSAISAPIVEALAERMPAGRDWKAAWELSEKRRAILRAHPAAAGLVGTPDGAAFVEEDRVLTSMEMRRVLSEQVAGTKAPPWMALDIRVFGKSQVSPVAQPLARAGGDLEVVAGIGSEELLFTRYRRTVRWVAALIISSLVTAVIGILMVHRTVTRERRLNDLKSQFVASVSHELRAPVASMRLMADALDAGTVTGEKGRQFQRLISQEGARLSALIENVLEFARIEEGRREYEIVETDLNALVRDTLQLMEPVACERNVTIERRLGESEGGWGMDPAAVQQAFINLLDNAIKFSPIGGKIQVALSFTSAHWTLHVADGGPGIRAEDRERVFERFIRLENELQRETQGAGIGLSIVKHTLDAHGGAIRIEDRSDGKSGAVFVVRCANRQPAEEGDGSESRGRDAGVVRAGGKTGQEGIRS